MTFAEQQLLVLDYLPLAHTLAWEKSENTPNSVTIDELKSAAYFGLVSAASKAESKENFHPYRKIQWAILDYLRSLSWGKRGHPAMGFTTDFSQDAMYGSDRYRKCAGILRVA
jgi:DNA-directed RNA polymerase specialized sigma subunit